MDENGIKSLVDVLDLVFSALREKVLNNLKNHAAPETRATPRQPWLRGWDDFKKGRSNLLREESENEDHDEDMVVDATKQVVGYIMVFGSGLLVGFLFQCFVEDTSFQSIQVSFDSSDFFNWNKVKIRYCDGASFAGHPESEFKNGTELFFRGQLIWETLMDELVNWIV